MKLIIDIPQKVNEHIRSWYGHGYFPQNGEDRNIIAKAIYDATLIPDNATNGDVIKAMLPNGTTAKFATFMRFIDGDHYFNCSEEWWNSPYQKGGKE